MPNGDNKIEERRLAFFKQNLTYSFLNILMYYNNHEKSQFLFLLENKLKNKL